MRKESHPRDGSKMLPVILIVRTILLCAILFELLLVYRTTTTPTNQSTLLQRQITTSTTTDENDSDNNDSSNNSDNNIDAIILNTHLALNNIDVEEISTNPNAKIHFQATTTKKKNRNGILQNNHNHNNRNSLLNRFRKKVTYTTQGAIVEDGNGITTPNSKIVLDLLEKEKQKKLRQIKEIEQQQQQQKQRNLIEMSKRHKEPKDMNITVAICFKTLFGDIDLGTVLQWAAYHRLLGFDHIFMWYRVEMKENPLFVTLQGIPYITLTENMLGNRKNYYRQVWTEAECNRNDQFAGTYDYVLHSDIDEYLWLNQKLSIKEFITQQNIVRPLNYLSFPKRMYTLDHSTTIDSNTMNYHIDTKVSDQFAVTAYPFYINHDFCYNTGPKRGRKYCPTWRGRAKVIVKPKMYTVIDTHGNIALPNIEKGEKHFDRTEAYFMEWPNIFSSHNVTKRIPVPFDIEHEDDVHIHNLERAFQPKPNNNSDKKNLYEMQYDSTLNEWFEFVISRYTPSETL